MYIATLTTDFGAADYYVAQFKGDLLRNIPALNIVDLSHDIPVHNIVSGAYALKHTYRHFPPGTVHILRVNEQGIGNEDIIVAFNEKQYFLAPDNGMLPLVFYHTPEWMFAVDVEKFKGMRVNDIYAQMCKHLLDSGYPELFLKEKPDIKQMNGIAVHKQSSQIRGSVVLVDRFGNIITNIHISDLTSYLNQFSNLTIEYRNKEKITTLVDYYNDVKRGDRLARFNDEGYLEIAQNEGNAASLLGIKFGDFVNVIFE
jgi:S-adenosylmethionine hydrolase